MSRRLYSPVLYKLHGIPDEEAIITLELYAIHPVIRRVLCDQPLELVMESHVRRSGLVTDARCVVNSLRAAESCLHCDVLSSC